MDEAFKRFTKNGTEATASDINKWCKDAGVYGKNLTSNHLDISFMKVKPKGGSKTISVREMDALISELATKYKDDKKLDLEAATSELKEKLINATSQAHGTTQAVAVGGVDRLTDTSKYTGSHKELFDESGKGKGAAGRTDATNNSGYVGGYKGAGTYMTRNEGVPVSRLDNEAWGIRTIRA